MCKKSTEELMALIAEKDKEIIELKHRLKNESAIDQLTGLLNKNVIIKMFELEMNKVERSLESFSIIMVDINGLEHINNQYGIHVGDEMLVEVGTRIQAFLRKQDIIARWDNDEFLIVLPETNKTQARNVEEALILEFKKFEYIYEGTTITCSIATGVAKYNIGESIEECMDKALDEIKSNKEKL